MRRFKTDILVRDNRLEMMQGRGIKLSYEILSDEDFVKELKKKAVEEAQELNNATDVEDIKEEIADIQEVLENIITAYDIKVSELEEIKKKKQNKIGKFDRRIKTHYVEIEDSNEEELEYYINRPDKYPEIS